MLYFPILQREYIKKEQTIGYNQTKCRKTNFSTYSKKIHRMQYADGIRDFDIMIILIIVQSNNESCICPRGLSD